MTDYSFLQPNEAATQIGTLEKPVYIISNAKHNLLVKHELSLQKGEHLVAQCPAISATSFGDPSFKADYGTKYCYHLGAMANGIASAELVIQAAKAGCIASFGAAGLVPAKVEEAIHTIKAGCGNLPFAFNLIHSPSEPHLEKAAVALYTKHGVKVVEASAFLDLTINIVHYSVAGLQPLPNGEVVATNKIIAKISRKEVAEKFMKPAPEAMLQELLAAQLITAEQYEWAKTMPVAQDITVEADSGGHTDNRPLVVLLPAIIALRNNIQAQYAYKKPIRIGAGGGIGTPEAALATFSMGAAYIVTGTINQACIESGTSTYVKKLLATVDYSDIMMAPAADMFELGVNLQVLKKGSLFGMRAKKLYELYRAYESIEEIPTEERLKIENQIFKKPLETIWADCIHFFNERDPIQITRAHENPKRKMALIFRWYLGLSSQWANMGVADRVMDYQIWCGAAMGAFNDWTKDSALAHPEHRTVGAVAIAIMQGVAELWRKNNLEIQGISLKK